MSQQKAIYCCLNCGENPNCCGVCGECPECCSDCGEVIQKCYTRAFLDINNNFYANWIYDGYFASSLFWNGQEDVDCWSDQLTTSSYDINLKIDEKGNHIHNGSIMNYTNDCCGDEGCCADEYGVPTGFERVNTQIKNNQCITNSVGKCRKEQYCPNSDCDYAWNEINSDCQTLNTIIFPIVDGNFDNCFNYPNERTIGDVNDCPAPDCATFITSTAGYGNVGFIDPVFLYDNEGNLVEDPWAVLQEPSTYDPCNPIRQILAPSCYIFYSV